MRRWYPRSFREVLFVAQMQHADSKPCSRGLLPPALRGESSGPTQSCVSHLSRLRDRLHDVPDT